MKKITRIGAQLICLLIPLAFFQNTIAKERFLEQAAAGLTEASRSPIAEGSRSPIAANAVFTENSSLVRDFQAALKFDSDWLRAQAIRDGGIEVEVQGLAGLLPQVQATAQRSRNSTRSELSRVGAEPVVQDISGYPAYQYVMQARQPVFRLRNWYGYLQGRAQAEVAQSNLVAARQDLALRLIAVLADWSIASALIDAAQLQLDAAEGDAESARQRLAAGDGTRVELETALSRRAQAIAALADARAGAENNLRLWRTITGLEDRVQPSLFSELVDKLPMLYNDYKDWFEAALRADGQIKALQLGIEVAEFELKKSQSDHYPTVDLLAQKSIQNSSNDFTIGNRYETSYLGVQLSVPIYSGGATQSVVRQAQANLRRAREDLGSAKNKISVAVDRDWRSLQTAKLEAAAARQAYTASSLVLRTSELGRQAGISILNERLLALAQQAASIRDLARANNRALASWARLMAAVGKLDDESIQTADRWLAEWRPSSASQKR